MRPSGGTRCGIGAQLKRIVLIPSLVFLALFAVVGAGTLGQAASLRSAAAESEAGAELTRALTDLRNERRLHAEYAADPRGERAAELAEATERTDTSVGSVRSLRERLGGRDDPATGDLAEGFFEALDEVERLRTAEPSGSDAVETALSTYTAAVSQGVHLYGSITRTLDDGSAAAEAAATTDLMWAEESFAHTDAFVSAALTDGELTSADQDRIAALTTDARNRIFTLHPGSDDAESPAPDVLLSDIDWQGPLAVADALAEHRPETPASEGDRDDDPTPPEDPGDWREAADPVNADLAGAVHARADSVVDTVESAGTWMLVLAAGSGLLALLAGVLAYVAAARSAKRITARLDRLRAQILGGADRDLPRIMHRLENGERVDLDTELEQLDHGTDEVGKVAEAFNTAQRAAVDAAVRQADLRSGANRVFLGIAHRNQSLVQRQLQLLDRIEREEDDPDLLESLFHLDHLATRGRRHAENLIILGGARPGRRWRHPIPLVDILRGAISESDEYARVRLTSIPDLSLSGGAVADVIHMLAELIENATAYSPPHTEVTVSNETVPKGVVIEIEDRGLGMTEEALAKANTTLAEAPEFDAMAAGADARLGLFVVARLAAKHDIAVELRPSPYGGTRAVVLVPGALTAASAEQDPKHPRVDGTARRSRPPETVPGPENTDLLAASGTRNARAVLRPVPTPQEADGATPTEAPVLRRVPDLAPAPDEAGTESGEKHQTPHREERVGTGRGRPGLPRRRRQVNLAPQLRRDAPTKQPTTRDLDQGVPEQRTPEQARQMMNAFSTGTRRGRAEQVGVPGGERSSDGQAGEHTGDHTGESD